jgi:hypothetical protein
MFVRPDFVSARVFSVHQFDPETLKPISSLLRVNNRQALIAPTVRHEDIQTLEIGAWRKLCLDLGQNPPAHHHQASKRLASA